MSKITNPTLVPELRFPEFINSWEIKHIGKVAKNLDSKRKPITQQDRISGSTPYYGASGIIDYVDGYIYDESLLCISEDGANLIARSYPIAFSIHGKTWVNNHAHVLKFKYSHTQTIVENYLNNISLEDYLTGMAQPKLNRAKLDIIPIPLPLDLKEQQKIAAFLSSMDDLIATNTKKLELLKFHKKGLMQKLFPVEGKSVPDLRFPEFTGKWKKGELGQLSTILRGGSPRPIENFLTKDKKALNWLKIGDVDKDAKYISMTQERVKVEALSKTRVVNSGDLIMSNSMSFGRPYIMKIQSCIHDGWIAVTDVSQSIDVNYLYYFILSDTSQGYFVNSAAGGGIKNLNADIIKKTSVFYAEDIKEQQKIAETLSSIDDLITENIKKLESLKSHKKGLIQKLFPEIKESIA
ncbi:hypothetical protein XM79_c12512 [Vibrio vulnificus]|uniref:restriction endonuclease subunit S n=1 Tax=Vibrio vulnificus TaxID=672 RepID=UPI0009B6A444|nr:restriction endonuclease subunit S [Vibrio vulnificus]OQK64204.1 hypothetical protein XM79_c12512 [Vibrio vulnificus]